MKRKFKFLSLFLSLVLVMGALVGCSQPASTSSENSSENQKEENQVTKDSNKKAILVVSFGTSYADTRAVTIEAVENKIKDTFKDYDVRRAFTSEIIIKKLKERDGIEIDNPTEALEKLKNEGFSQVVVQPLHVICGAEYNDLLDETRNFEGDFDKLVVGNPLLTTIEDYKEAVEALKAQMPELKEGEAVAFMGHGTHHPANASYPCMQQIFEDMGMNNVFVGTVEGYPELDNVIEKLKENKIDKVTLMPFMLVAGDHANNDMAGDEEDSWKSILKKEGFIVETYIHGLGENAGIQDLYIKHTEEAVNN